MVWRIYYDDGSVFTDADGSPYDAPRTGVQAIAQPNETVGWYILTSADAFYWEEEREGWNKADEYTKWDHLIRAKYPLLVFGRMMATPDYKKLVDKIRAELPKQGWLQTERNADA